MLTAEQILENWNELIRIINSTFSGERKEKILKLFEHFENRMPYTPASHVSWFHNAFRGGYVLHIMNVIEAGKRLKELWSTFGCDIGFTDEELIFACLFHDLGKVGDLDNDFYIPQTSEWHQRVKGEIYTMNPAITYMNSTDRTFWLLWHFDIKCSMNEFLGIRLADGLYEPTNEKYLVNYQQKVPRNTIIYIVHAADFMASRKEYDEWNKTNNDGEKVVSKESKYPKKQTFADVAKTALPDSALANFDDLFEKLDAAKKDKEKNNE